MSDRRIDIDELGGLSELPPDDPRRQALESQPSARARLRAYEAFMSGGDVPDGANVAEAEARLAEALEREIGVDIAGSPRRPAPAAAAGGRMPLLRWLTAPRLRPALVAAVFAIAFSSVWIATRPQQKDAGDVLRGAPPPAVPGAWSAGAASEPLPDGTLRLCWNPAPTADRYAVVFLAGDLSEIARVNDLVSTQVDLRPDSLPAGLRPGGAVLWRIVAYEGRDELGRSPVAPITLP
jgi:hypothetical protein